jgi:hypothetical protein
MPEAFRTRHRHALLIGLARVVDLERLDRDLHALGAVVPDLDVAARGLARPQVDDHLAEDHFPRARPMPGRAPQPRTAPSREILQAPLVSKGGSRQVVHRKRATVLQRSFGDRTGMPLSTRSAAAQPKLPEGHLVELEAHLHVRPAARVAGFLEIAVVEADHVPADRYPAVRGRTEADARPADQLIAFSPEPCRTVPARPTSIVSARSKRTSAPIALLRPVTSSSSSFSEA